MKASERLYRSCGAAAIIEVIAVNGVVPAAVKEAAARGGGGEEAYHQDLCKRRAGM